MCCFNDVESVKHMFFGCSKTLEAWNKISQGEKAEGLEASNMDSYGFGDMVCKEQDNL